MTRTFEHYFEPASASPITGQTAHLTVQEIEDAGIREVLQTPGAALGCWALLDALLEPTGTGSPFVFREPLGQAREVKVALSGLFGRFVARAYLERYVGLSIFAHLGRRPVLLDGRRRVEVQRIDRGDLPDWLACSAGLSSLTIAEAKGCHDKAGAHNALERAWMQAHRINVVSRGRRATVKRIAIATRWASSNGGANNPILSIRDPVDQGEPLSPKEIDAALIGVARLHVANLLGTLGYDDLVKSLRDVVMARPAAQARSAAGAAQRALDAVPVHEIAGEDGFAPADGVVGNFVTRTGPLRGITASREDQEALRRLDLRPVFIGLERRFVKAVITGNADLVRELVLPERRATGAVRTDGAACWMVRVGEGIAIE